MEFLQMLLAFLVAISLLIAVHEFGHFWVAKKLGVKVLRYSIGFGKPIWKRRWGADQTEYMIAALPLGGYVKMLDERDGDVPAQEVHRAFNRQPVLTRMAVVFAGPLFNFLFAIIAYWGMFVLGMTSMKPMVGEIFPGSPAERAGLQYQDEIIAVDGNETPIFEIAAEALFLGVVEKGRLNVLLRDMHGREYERIVDLSAVESDLKPADMFRAIGFMPWLPSVPAIVGEVREGTPAAGAGIKSDDRITHADGVEIGDWRELVGYVQKRPGQTIKLSVDRQGEEIVMELAPAPVTVSGKTIGQIGITNKIEAKIPDEMLTHYQYPLFGGFVKAVTTMWDKTVLSLKLFGKLLTGVISVKNLSGPIGIAQHAGSSASAGLPWFLGFLAVVSINLGILNLLPVPILDGGHLLYYLIEMVKGSPVSEAVEAFGQRLGIALLIALMMLAFYNDLARIFE